MIKTIKTIIAALSLGIITACGGGGGKEATGNGNAGSGGSSVTLARGTTLAAAIKRVGGQDITNTYDYTQTYSFNVKNAGDSLIVVVNQLQGLYASYAVNEDYSVAGVSASGNSTVNFTKIASSPMSKQIQGDEWTGNVTIWKADGLAAGAHEITITYDGRSKIGMAQIIETEPVSVQSSVTWAGSGNTITGSAINAVDGGLVIAGSMVTHGYSNQYYVNGLATPEGWSYIELNKELEYERPTFSTASLVTPTARTITPVFGTIDEAAPYTGAAVVLLPTNGTQAQNAAKAQAVPSIERIANKEFWNGDNQIPVTVKRTGDTLIVNVVNQSATGLGSTYQAISISGIPGVTFTKETSSELISYSCCNNYLGQQSFWVAKNVPAGDYVLSVSFGDDSYWYAEVDVFETSDVNITKGTYITRDSATFTGPDITAPQGAGILIGTTMPNGNGTQTITPNPNWLTMSWENDDYNHPAAYIVEYYMATDAETLNFQYDNTGMGSQGVQSWSGSYLILTNTSTGSSGGGVGGGNSGVSVVGAPVITQKNGGTGPATASVSVAHNNASLVVVVSNMDSTEGYTPTSITGIPGKTFTLVGESALVSMRNNNGHQGKASIWVASDVPAGNYTLNVNYPSATNVYANIAAVETSAITVSPQMIQRYTYEGFSNQPQTNSMNILQSGLAVATVLHPEGVQNPLGFTTPSGWSSLGVQQNGALGGFAASYMNVPGAQTINGSWGSLLGSNQTRWAGVSVVFFNAQTE